VVADENAVQRIGVRAMLASSARIDVVAEARGLAEAGAYARDSAPDVILLGLHRPLPDVSALLPRFAGRTRVIVVSAVADPTTVLRLVGAGARGYLVHGHFEQQDLVDAVLGTAAGHAYLSPPAAAALVDQVHGQAEPPAASGLTPRECEVMELVAAGLTNHEIAARLVISRKTAKNHVHHVYKRLNVDSRMAAVALWRHISPESARPAR
jgi:DNA-binding NarL/FixJ family response regulator